MRNYCKWAVHRFSPETHRCIGCDRWERGFAPQTPVAKPKPRAECQICEGVQALDHGRITNHGYRRPGWGMIVGNCPGKGHQPYPATTALVQYRGALQGHIDHHQTQRELVAAAESLTYSYKTGYGSTSETRSVTVTAGTPSQLNGSRWIPSFDNVQRQQLYNHEREVRMATDDLARVEARIAKALTMATAEAT